MTVEIISWSISTKVWDRAGIELTTPGSAVRLTSVARHVIISATGPVETIGETMSHLSYAHTIGASTWENRLWGFWPSQTQTGLLPYIDQLE